MTLVRSITNMEQLVESVGHAIQEQLDTMNARRYTVHATRDNVTRTHAAVFTKAAAGNGTADIGSSE